MAWFKKTRTPIAAQAKEKPSRVPEGLWVKCPDCSQVIYNKDLAANLSVCPKCTHHFRINAVNTPGETNGADQTFTTAARACRLGPERDRGWEIALAHAKSRTGALTVLRHAHKLAGSSAKLERDGCTDYEPAIVGLKSKRAAEALLRRAKSAGFAGASIERS